MHLELERMLGPLPFSFECGDDDLEQRRERPRFRFDARRDERFSSVREHDDVTGLEVRSGMFEEAEVVAGVVVEALGRHAR